MKQIISLALLTAVLVLAVCACAVTTPPTAGSTAEPTSPSASASDTPTLPPTSGSYRPTEGPTQPSATGPVLPTDEEKYLARITAALTATSPERSQSTVSYAMDGVTLVSSFTYTASENRTVYTKQRLGELTAEGGDRIVTESGSHDGRAVTPDEGITLSDLSLALSYFSAVTFNTGEETLTMNAYLSDVAVASVFGRAPTGGTGFCLHIVLSGDRITELCLSYRTSDALVTVQSQYAY